MPTKKKTAASRGKRRTKKKDFTKGRLVWAAVCIFAGFLACLSACGVKGWLITAYDCVARVFYGYGACLLPFAFVAAGLILFVKYKGKARLKVFSVMMMPAVVGGLRQFSLETCSWKIAELYKSGQALNSAGVISGYVADIFEWAISNIGATILFWLLLVAFAFMAFGEFIVKLVVYIKSRQPEPDEPPIELPHNPPREPSPVRTVERAKPQPFNVEPEKPSEPAPSASNVKTPAEGFRSIFGKNSEKKIDIPMDKPRAAENPSDPTLPRTPSFAVADAELSVPESNFAPSPEKPDPALNAEVAQEIENALSEKEDKYMFPPINLLTEGSGKVKGAEEAIKACGDRLIDALLSFGVESTLVGITSGPTVTRFELQLQRGIKVSRVEGLSTDIALALGSQGVRISTIPDKNAIGVEIANEVREMVTLRDIVGTQKFRDSESKLSFAVGKDINGDCVVGDISKMPHMLIAGTTGSGKSVCINSMLMSLLYKSTPEEVRLIMVDPKMIELKVYNGIPHLLIPVVTDPRKAAGALNWAVTEMMKRYQLFSEIGARDLKGYNAEMKKRPDGQTLPQVVIVIDELSDLMVAAKKEVEEAIIRLAQMARAAGMHLIIATQSPRADVITGLMKANIPSRIAFAVSGQLESRIILDQMGAEKLIGKGDMLYAPLGAGKPKRIQGCFVSDGEVERVVEFIKSNGEAHYSEEIEQHIENHGKEQQEAQGDAPNASVGDADDEMLEAAIECVIESGQASTSLLQRRLKLGYARAARIMDMMEERGIIGQYEGSKPRQILISKDQWMEIKLRKSDNG